MLRDLNAPGDRYVGPHTVGLLGSTIPSQGANGPGYLYPLVQNDPSLANEELRGKVIVAPQFGSWFAYDDSSFSYDPTQDGNDSFIYQPYKGNQLYGDPVMVELISGDPAPEPGVAKVSFTARLMNHMRAIGF